MPSKQKLRWTIETITIDDATINSKKVRAILEPLWWTVEDASKEEYHQSTQLFTPEQRSFHALVKYKSEVDNGGHKQFYWNTSGIVAGDVQKGFELLKIPEMESVIQESIHRMGHRLVPDVDLRRQMMESNTPTFDDLDKVFYIWSGAHDLDKLMQTFIAEHRDQFYFTGEVRMLKLVDIE